MEPQVNVGTSNEKPSLHSAALNGQLSIVQQTLKDGAQRQSQRTTKQQKEEELVVN